MVINKRALSECKDVRSFYGIDIAKFICAILVVAIHVAPFGKNGNLGVFNYGIQNYLARLAVPFFFITSGFLLFRKIDINNFDLKYPINYSLKLLRLYLIWVPIYGFLIVKSLLSDDLGRSHPVLMFIRNFFFIGSDTPLWYLPATIYAVLLISVLLYKKISIKKIMILSGIIYVIGLLGQSYFGLLAPLKNVDSLWHFLKLSGTIIATTRNFEAFLFVGIGMLLAYVPINIKFKKSVVYFWISMILFLFETFFLHKIGFIRRYDMFIMLVPSVFFLFYIVSHIEIKERKIYRTLRLLSSLIFYTHMWVKEIVSIVMDKFAEGLWGTTPLDFIITLVFSCALSYAIIKISDIKQLSWLKKLYT